MEINRDNLRDRLYNFSISGNGLIVGKPGVGKSTLITTLKRILVENGILSFVIRVDNMFDFSDQAINLELKLSTNWIDTFKNIKLQNGQKAVLFFDGFDAARDEQKRQGFLSQIKKAISVLSEKWNIIVSSRSYDAEKSQDLLNLFPIYGSDKSSKLIRKIEVNEFYEEDLSQLQSSQTSLWQFYSSSNQELKQILKIPFFLNLLKNILDNDKSDLDEIKTFKSETQLLNEYWRLKIIDTTDHITKENFISGLSKLMVEKRTLSISKDESKKYLEKVQDFDYLRGENIILESGAFSNTISFSHNIIFDYAISRYCIPYNWELMNEFMLKEKSKIFFFRPSFIYFFTTLWHYERADFWKFYQTLSKDKNQVIQLFLRLIISTVIASEYDNNEDLSPITNETDVPERVTYLLQSIRFIRNKTKPVDLDLLLYLSDKLNITFLFEFGFLLNRAVDDSPNSLHEEGIASRNFLNFIIDGRKNTKFRDFFDRIGASQAISLIAKTYSSDVLESRATLQRILEMLREPDFEINYFSSLTEELKGILPIDHHFVSEVYRSVFGHDEKSTAQTTMGNTVIFNMMGNRRQDFGLCQFRLQRIFPEFLKLSPEIAVPLGIDIVNDYVVQRREYSSDNNPKYFTIDESNFTILSDYSYMWSERRVQNETTLELAYDIFDYFGYTIINSDIEQVFKILDINLQKFKVGFLWKMFFELISQYPEKFYKKYLALAINPIILKTNEVTYEVRKFLIAAMPFFDERSKLMVEKSFLETFNSPKDEPHLIAYLSIFPKEQMQIERSKDLMVDKQIQPNEPLVKYSSSVTEFTTKDWLSENGVNIEGPEKTMLLSSIDKIESFNRQFINSGSELFETTQILHEIKAVFKIVNSEELEESLFFTSTNCISQAASILSRNFKNQNEEDNKLIGAIIIFCFKAKTKYDDGNEGKSPASGYSPTPRTNAAMGLIPIYCQLDVPSTLELIREAATDPSAPVRFNLLLNVSMLYKHDYKFYRDIIIERLHNENDSFIYGYLISDFIIKNDSINEDVNLVIKNTMPKIKAGNSNRQLLDSFSHFLIYYSVRKDVKMASDVLINAYNYPELCNTLIFYFFKDTVSFTIGVDQDGYRKLYQLTHHYVRSVGEQLIERTQQKIDFESKDIQEGINLIDQVVMRIYFNLEPRNRNNNRQNQITTERLSFIFLNAKPILEEIIEISGKLTSGGFMLGRTAHYFIQLLNIFLPNDPQWVLSIAANVTRYSYKAGYTLDSSSIREIVKFTEILLADHRELLATEKAFSELLDILDLYMTSGWVDAMRLLWRMDEVFK